MSITERTLKKWRREALQWEPSNMDLPNSPNPDTIMSVSEVYELHNRILQMTQELLDQHLLRKK